MKLKYHKHYEIDKQKWDQTIQSSDSPLVYAMSWYLDIVSPNWSAIISSDYQYVMPICIKLKFGCIPIITHPILCQQLGVFSTENKKISKEKIKQFIKQIPFYFVKKNIQFNHLCEKIESFSERQNFILNCNKTIQELEKNYSSQIKRNIKKAVKNHLSFDEYKVEFAIEDFLNWKANQVNLTKSITHQFTSILKQLNHQQKLLSYYVKDSQGNVHASCILIQFKNTLTLASLSSSPEGFKTGASSLLLHRIIQQNSSKSVTFDFEGSSLSSLARFYKGFGATKQTYYLYQKP